MITMERMREDIAAVIGEQPEAIGPDDSLLDLGLDSMRLMTLMLEWEEAGASPDFGEFAERFTLAGLWEAVQRRGTAPRFHEFAPASPARK